jgi:hypothetical protein
MDLVRQSIKAFDALPKERQAELRHAQRKSWVIGETMLSHPEMTREQAEALYSEMDPTDTMVADAYERGRRDENEECAKVAEDRAKSYARSASTRKGTPLGSSHTDKCGASASIASRIRARIKKEGASDE